MPVDRSRVKALIDQHVKALRNALGLNHWTIETSVGPCDNPDHAACLSAKPEYERGRINIDPEQHPDEEEVYESLLHELLHCVHAPMTLYRKAIVAAMEEGSDEAAREAALWHIAQEQQVCGLRRMFGGLRDHFRAQWEAEQAARAEAEREPEPEAGNGRPAVRIDEASFLRP